MHNTSVSPVFVGRAEELAALGDARAPAPAGAPRAPPPPGTPPGGVPFATHPRPPAHGRIDHPLCARGLYF
ncbi:hypothetical protein ACFW9V_09870, partial [Streptomyces hygroscopicus]